MSRPHVTAVIQMRLSSSRFPAKGLRKLVGRPILWHIVHRLWKCKNVETVCVATSVEPSDDPLEELTKELGVTCVRGPLDNVLARFGMALDACGGDFVIRICGDCPLIDPGFIDKIIELMIETGAETDIDPGAVPCIHEGFDVVRASTLRRLVSERADDPIAREHVTGYFKEDPGFARSCLVPIPPEHIFEGARISVDTPADLEFLEVVYGEIGAEPGEIDVADVVTLLKSKPELMGINAHVRQKKAYDVPRTVVFRCDASPVLGYGHVKRCLALANVFRERFSWGVTFVANADAATLIEADGFRVVEPPASSTSGWHSDWLAGQKPDALVIDLRDVTSKGDVADWKAASGAIVVVLDDPSDRRLAADFAFYPPVPQVWEHSWEQASTQVYSGWQWIVLGNGRARASASAETRRPKLVVTMGGSDPFELTELALKALNPVAERFEIEVVIGPGNKHINAPVPFIHQHLPSGIPVVGADSLVPYFSAADMALCSFGVSAYEAVRHGCPPIVIALDDDALRSASVLAAEKVGVVLGLAGRVDEAAIRDAVLRMHDEPATRTAMSDRGKILFHGDGSKHVAEIVVSAVNRVDEGPQ